MIDDRNVSFDIRRRYIVAYFFVYLAEFSEQDRAINIMIASGYGFNPSINFVIL